MKSSSYGNIKLLVFVILIPSLFMIQCDSADIDYQQLEQLLGKIAKYEYNQSLEPMVHLDQIIRNANNEKSRAKIENLMLIQLKSECTYDGIDQICRRLRLIGTENSVPVLKEMLKDSVTFEMSLYALELITGSAIDDLLYQEFLTRTGSQKVRLINLMGIRSVEKALPQLKELIYSPENDVSAASISAIKQMPAPKSIKVILAAIDKTTGDLQIRMLSAALEVGEKLDNKSQKKSICLMIINNNNYPLASRLPALRQLILLSPEDAADLINKLLSNEKSDLRPGLFGLVHLLPDGDGLNRIIANTANYTPYEIIMLIHALERKSNNNYSDFFLECAKSKNSSIRTAGLAALRYAKSAAVIPYLVSATTSASNDEKLIARESLYTLNAPEADASIMNLLEKSEGKEKIELIRCIGQRQIAGSVSILSALATNENKQISRSAVKSLSYVSNTSNIDELTRLLINLDDITMQKELTTLLQKLVQQVHPPEDRAVGILNQVNKISDINKKIQLFQILGASGNPRALPVLSSALDQKEPELEKAAIRALSLWPHEGPADILLAKVKSTNSGGIKILAFRGYLRLLDKSENLDNTQLLQRYQEAMDLAPNNNEKKTILSTLAELSDFAAAEYCSQFLNDTNLRSEAEVAIVNICRLVAEQTEPEKIKKIIQPVIDQTKNEDVLEGAMELMKRVN